MSSPHLPGRRPARVAAAALLAVAALTPRVITVGATMAGDGAVAGGIDYPDPNGLWFVGGCQAATWTLGLTGAAAAVDTLNDENAGIAGISATGSTACPLFESVETGTVTSLSASSRGALGDLECPSMSGSYTRILALWTVTVSGDCTLNGKPEAGEQLTVRFTGAPTSIGGDLGSFTSFAVAGTATWS